MPTATVPDLAVLAERFGATIDAVADDAWHQPSPCAEWTAADVVSHVIDTQWDFLAGHGLVDAFDDEATDEATDDDPATAWRIHSAGVSAALADPGVADRAIDTPFGPTTIKAALLRFYGFDLVVHRWDVARATGGDSPFTSAECDLVEESIDSFGEHMYADGICRPAVDVGPVASRRDHLLARTGRDPNWAADPA